MVVIVYAYNFFIYWYVWSCWGSAISCYEIWLVQLNDGVSSLLLAVLENHLHCYMDVYFIRFCMWLSWTSFRVSIATQYNMFVIIRGFACMVALWFPFRSCCNVIFTWQDFNFTYKRKPRHVKMARTINSIRSYSRFGYHLSVYCISG